MWPSSLMWWCGLLLLLVSCEKASGECLYDTSHGATYDLTALHAQTGFKIQDETPEERNYEYIFSLCKDVDAAYLTEQTSSECDATTLGASPAYQYIGGSDGSPGTCEKMGDTYANDLNVRWGVHNQEDPSAGVVLTYLNGDTCVQTGTKRSFELHFICRDDASRSKNIPTEEFVEEETLCVYRMNIFTGYGCPTECVRGGDDDVICGGKGVCGYDSVTEKARCFCDEGYTGDGCVEEGSSSSSSSSSSGGSSGGLVAALVIMCLLLVGVVALVVYMGMKLRKLQLDPDAYSQLGNRFNELGQVSEGA